MPTGGFSSGSPKPSSPAYASATCRKFLRFRAAYHGVVTHSVQRLLDNLYVDGSSSPIVEQDAERNTYQTRTLSDGSVHRVFKNFPTRVETDSLVTGLSTSAAIREWRHFWAVECMTAEP